MALDINIDVYSSGSLYLNIISKFKNNYKKCFSCDCRYRIISFGFTVVSAVGAFVFVLSDKCNLLQCECSKGIFHKIDAWLEFCMCDDTVT